MWRLKLIYDKALLSFNANFNLRPYTEEFRAAANIPAPATPKLTLNSADGGGAAASLGKDLAVEARHMVGVCLASVGDTRRAVEWYDKVLKLEPAHREALTNKAQGLREMASEPQAGLGVAAHEFECKT